MKHAALFLVAVAAGCDGGISLDYKDYIPHPEICVDGIDNDGNGLIDCDDPACFQNAACQRPKGHGLVEGEGEGEGIGGEGEGIGGEGEGIGGEGEGEGEGAVCGDGVVGPGEVCDGFNLSGQNCLTEGFESGVLACSSDCTAFDTSGCSGRCGDGVIGGFESCDGANLNNKTCTDFGFGTGTLACTSGCQFDTSQCVAAFCGDGIRDGGEQCEGTDVNGETCFQLGFGIGTVLCNASCTFDTSQCQAPFCGDGIRDGSEQCEGTDVQGETCLNFGLGLGFVSCNSSCTFDTSTCQPAVCGDGIRDGNEACEGSDLQGETCANFTTPPGGTGTLACSSSCTFDTSGCVNPFCGDGVVNGSEQCEGANLQGQTCQGLQFQSGTLACAADCTFDTSQCVPFVCGNGVREGPEVCDRGDLANQTCQSQTNTGGVLACSSDCKSFDTSGCGLLCGNGVVDPGEQCDDHNNTSGDVCSSTCQLEVTPTAEVEPNSNDPPQPNHSDFNVAAAHQVFSSDALVNGGLSVPGDEDEYIVANNTASPVIVRFQTYAPVIGQCNGDTILQVFSASGVSIAFNDDDGAEGFGTCSTIRNVSVPANGTVIVDVTAFGDNSVIDPYQLVIDFP